MKPILIATLLVFSLASINAQRSIGDLQPAHAEALKVFLKAEPGHKFLSETVIDAGSLASMREAFGRAFKPYYVSGDFNGDRNPDFAVLITLGGAPIDQGRELAATHRYERKLAIVVFNGTKDGKFSKAFREPVQAPYVSYLSRSDDRQKSLQFGIFETDAAYTIAPTGKGYVLKEVEY